MTEAHYVEQPDGPLYIAITSEHNPYRTHLEPEPIPAIRLEQQRNFVMFCAILDFFINMWEFSIMGNLVSLVFSAISIIGYRGAKLYNYRLLITYTVYQFMLMMSKWAFLGFILYRYAHDREKYTEAFWIVSSISVPIQTYIFINLFSFYRNLPRTFV